MTEVVQKNPFLYYRNILDFLYLFYCNYFTLALHISESLVSKICRSLAHNQLGEVLWQLSRTERKADLSSIVLIMRHDEFRSRVQFIKL